MRENIKKSFYFAVFLSCLCAIFLCTYLFPTAKALAVDDTITISTETELKNYVTNYDVANANDKIVLGANINMSSIVLNSTIGTQEIPFAGTFDGRGYTISNLNVDVSQTETLSNAYVGLFGVTNGATISNVALSGTVNLTAGDCVNAYVGGLVSRAISTTIKNCQTTAKINFNNLDNNINFGSLVGYAIDSDISYVVCRSQGFGTWTFSTIDNQVMRFGGVVGNLLGYFTTLARFIDYHSVKLCPTLRYIVYAYSVGETVFGH